MPTLNSIPPLFHRWLMTALESTPADSGAASATSQDRPMPRPKVAAAYFHCLKLSLVEIARGASSILHNCDAEMERRGEEHPHNSVSYGQLEEWRTELEFHARVERAKAEMIGALKGAYDTIQTPEEFELFATALMDYQLDIVFALVRYAEAVAESSEERLRQIWADQLFQGWARACAGILGDLSPPQIRDTFPLLELIEGARSQFASAEENGDWPLAREAFDSIAVLARLHVAQSDTRTHRVTAPASAGPTTPKAN